MFQVTRVKARIPLSERHVEDLVCGEQYPRHWRCRGARKSTGPVFEEKSEEKQRTRTYMSIGLVQTAAGTKGEDGHIRLGVEEGRWGRAKGSFHGSSDIRQKLGGNKSDLKYVLSMCVSSLKNLKQEHEYE